MTHQNVVTVRALRDITKDVANILRIREAKPTIVMYGKVKIIDKTPFYFDIIYNVKLFMCLKRSHHFVQHTLIC